MNLETVNKEHEYVKALEEAVIAAEWVFNHIFDTKTKRVDWGKTFAIDWGKMNESLVKTSKGKRLIQERNP